MTTQQTQDEQGTQDQETTEQPVTVTDTILTGARDALVEEMDKLRASYEEYVRIEGLLTRFDTVSNGTPAKPQRRRGTSSTADRAPRGTRLMEFITVVQNAGEEGLTVSEAAALMGDDSSKNYLYRIAKEAEANGDVKKVDKRYVATTVPVAA